MVTVNETVPRMKPTTAAKLKMTKHFMAASFPAFGQAGLSIFVPLDYLNSAELYNIFAIPYLEIKISVGKRLAGLFFCISIGKTD
jgi:hypothetical protein